MKSQSSATSARLVVSSMMQGHVRSRLVCAAAKLGVADYFTDGPHGAGELALRAGIPEAMLFRLMRGFVSCGLLHHREDGQFELTALGETLKSGSEHSLRDIAIRIHDLDYHAWGALLDAAQTGQTAFDSIFGAGLYEYLAQSSSHQDAFHEEMAANTSEISRSLVAAYDFTWAKTIVDVGGGHGVLLNTILQKNPSATGILFESPSAIAGAQKREDLVELAGRCTLVAGDFLRSVPHGGDLYVLKLVLHNWNDELCVKILQHCRAAMDNKGRMLIIERLMPERVQSSNLTVGSDLTMFVLVGGAERSPAEFELILHQAGLSATRFIRTDCPLSLIEAVPS